MFLNDFGLVEKGKEKRIIRIFNVNIKQCLGLFFVIYKIIMDAPIIIIVN